ncbi:ROK family protein [Nocardioides baculatus]|uniref:ROK family protein n=1 Tax=Nocardioides baculatus TaxID=2801337 RepID=A0ABS1L4E7_9ACTN|nr:ROK family protein [Nocardioides baculatus]MBL0746397.1 ROK family protein [Nocardioides baculatus]
MSDTEGLRRSASGTEGLRRANTGAVLRALRELGPSTRSELATHTGLAKATVGVIVADLEAARAVAEEGSRPGVRGRPGRPVALRGDRFVSLGLELNVDYVSAVVLDLAGDIVSTTSRAGGTSDDLSDLARSALDEHVGADDVLVGTTLAVPALVRADDRTVAWAPNLRVEWADLADALGSLVPDVRVGVSNDANCAAYAESHHGAARGASHALYVTGTVGIGAGIVQDGELVRGGAGFAGEVGHMAVGDSTALCGCGRRGCWEASIGMKAMLAAVDMSELDTPLRTAEAVAERAATDASVRDGLERVGRDVGLGIAVLSTVLDPEVVVMGGYFAVLGDLVLEPARRTLDERLVSAAQVRPELRTSTLGIEAAALGAAEQSFGPVLLGEVDLLA